MKNEKLEQYFKSLNGKSIDIKKNKLNLQIGNEDFSNEHDEIVKLISSEDYEERGKFKACYYPKSFAGYAILKSLEKTTKCDKQFNKKINAYIIINKVLKRNGACIPTLYSMFYADNNYIEVQEKILGQPIAYANLGNLVEKIFGKDANIKMPLDNNNLQIVREALFNYNIKQQEKMINMPQDHFNNLFKTYLLFQKMCFTLNDAHSGNVLMGDNGFTIVDLDYKNIESQIYKGQKPNINNVIKTFLRPFMSVGYSITRKTLSASQIEKLRQNNVIIFKKLTNAITANNVLMDMNLNKESYISAVGMLKYFAEYRNIFESQIILAKIKKNKK